MRRFLDQKFVRLKNVLSVFYSEERNIIIRLSKKGNVVVVVIVVVVVVAILRYLGLCREAK